jgi:hypothetical protein
VSSQPDATVWDWRGEMAGSQPVPLSGRVLSGRYELRRRLGRGGMADVYRAVDLSLGRAVAVKVFHVGYGPEIGERGFHSEVWTLAGLQHRNLVTLYDAGVDGEDSYLVLQLVRGTTLADRLRQGPLPPDDVARIGCALAEALACVHAHGILHRDVKPSNVLLAADGGVYLTDFGVSCLLGATGVTATGTVMGTPAYLAPEQVAGRSVEAPADVYALGLVLLECLTGQREYQGSPVEAALARLSRPPHVPRRLAAGWCRLLEDMTTGDPAQRPTASTVAGRLRRLATRQAPAYELERSASPPAAPVWSVDGQAEGRADARSPRRRWRHRPGAAAAAAAIVVCLGVLGIAGLVSAGRSTVGVRPTSPSAADRMITPTSPSPAAATPNSAVRPHSAGPTTAAPSAERAIGSRAAGPTTDIRSVGRNTAEHVADEGRDKAKRHDNGPPSKQKGHSGESGNGKTRK